MAMINKLTITIHFLISLAFFHSLAFHEDFEEFEPPHQGGPRGRGGWEEGSTKTENPYHLDKWSFENLFQSNQGFVKVLPKFTEFSSSLFRGIENYRFGFMEMEPSTFLVPHHFDADLVFLVLQGEGDIEFVTDKTKESFKIKKGDVMRVPSGITLFITNTNDTVSLRIAKIVVSVNIPGHFQSYFPAGSQYQQSYFNGFSTQLLSASFNVPEELLRSLIAGREERREGIIRRFSPDEFEEITKHGSIKNKDKEKKEKEKSKHKGGKMWSPFNLLSQDPIYSNDYGHFHEAHPQRFGQLQDLNIAVAWVNMTKGSLFLPHFNSKTTFVTFVENGCARFEMASHHASQQQQWPGQGDQEEEGQVQKIVSRVCKGEVFIIPAGHPFAVLSQDQNFVAIGFGINASNSTRTFLAGEENMLSKLDTMATRLSFGVGSKMAEKLFTSQNYSYFAPTTPTHQFPQKPKQSFQSIFNFAGF